MSARARVGDVLELERFPVAPSPHSDYVAIGIRSFGKGIFHYEPKPGDQLGKLRYFEVRPDRLLVSNIKGWEGAIAVSSQRDAGCIASNRFLSYRPIADEIDVVWAKWFFLSELGLSLVGRASPGSADRNRTLAIERFENLEIPLPPIDEQRRIAERLDRLSECASRVVDATLRGGVSEITTVLPDLVDVILKGCGTSVAAVADLAEFMNDTVHPGEDPSPADRFVGLQHVESHTGRAIGHDALGPMKGRKFRFAPGDVVYGYLRPYLNKVWVADAHGLCSVDQYVLRPTEGVDAELLAAALRGRTVLDCVIEKTHSLQLPRLRSGLLGAIEVPVIPEKRAPEILARLQRVQALVLDIARSRDRQQELTACIVPSALNEAFAGLS